MTPTKTDLLPCPHENFEVIANVGRLSKEDGGPITHYTADINIKCRDCGQPFEFLGLPMGHSAYQSTVSIDGLELRAAIMPQGQKPPEGLSGFSVKMHEVERDRHN